MKPKGLDKQVTIAEQLAEKNGGKIPSFAKAKTFARSLKLKSTTAWNSWISLATAMRKHPKKFAHISK